MDSPKKREEFTEKVKLEYVGKARNPESAVGILFDGHWIIIIKKISKTLRWDIIEQPFNLHSLFEMLLLLINVDKRRLTAESLNADFSTQNQFGKKIIRVLFKKLLHTKNNRTLMLFNEWNRSFSSIYKHAFDNPKVKKDFESIMKGFDISETSYDKFLFVLQTYYAFIVKLIASEAASTVAHGLIGSYVSTLSSSENLKEDLTGIENGGVFKESLKIENFVEGDFFAWYLEEWDDELEISLKEIILKLSDYNFATFVEFPEETKDLLKRFYQFIVPKQLRHDLGEYYTPDWLAQHLIEEARFDGDPNKKVLDPSCGSGTFLVEFIKKIILLNRSRSINKKQLCELITQNVVGFDINPIAVLTARTNYLLALSPILRDIGFETLNIPVFLSDSIILPQKREALQGRLYLIQTIKGDFWMPEEVVEKQVIDPLLGDIERYLADYSAEEFKTLIRKRYSFKEESVDTVGKTFTKIKELNEINENKVWTKIIKNSFAPVFRMNQFDYVIGNPPWVNWEFLSDEYAKLLKGLSSSLGIFAFTGKEARHGHAKDDLAAIFTYACSNYYLKDGGRLAFLIKPLFQNPAGKGFRQFKFKSEKNKMIPLSIQLVEDLTEIKPFEGAQNETAIIVLVKGQKTRYPVKFIKWEKKTSSEITQTETLEKVYESTLRLKKIAEPSNKEDQSSGWFISTKKDAEQFDTLKRNFLGTFEYPIRTGIYFGLNGVFWFDIIKRVGEKIRIKNNSEKAKKTSMPFETTIERRLVYPIIKSRHLSKYKINGYIYGLVPQ
ncbi:MAG: Eco57I restriction-modification methylase domain-containing protein, partial [Caldisphaera sp.]